MNFFNSITQTSTLNTNQTTENPYAFIIMLILFGLIFYFMILRPQQKKNKEHKQLINSLTKGDEILTTSGMIGEITKISKSEYITIALNESNKIIIKKDFVVSILPKGTIKSI